MLAQPRRVFLIRANIWRVFLEFYNAIHVDIRRVKLLPRLLDRNCTLLGGKALPNDSPV